MALPWSRLQIGPFINAVRVVNLMPERLYRIYDRVILSHPWLWIAFIAVMVAIAGFQARHFKLDASADSLILEHDEALRYYRDIYKRYGSDDFLIITYTPVDALWSTDSFKTLQALKEALLQLERIESVVSILDVPLLNSPRISLKDLAEPPRTLASPGVDIKQAQQEFLHSPIYRNLLVSPDGKTTALLAYFKRDETYYALLEKRNDLQEKRRNLGRLTDAEAQTLRHAVDAFKQYNTLFIETQSKDVAKVRAILDQHRSQAQIFLGGLPMIISDMIDFIASDLVTFGLAAACLIVVVMWLFFRRLRWILLPLLSCAISVCLIVGALSWLDWRVTVISSNFISILIIITISLIIHLIVRYGEFYAAAPSQGPVSLARRTVRRMFEPCFYTAITTIVAFMSLVVSGIRPVIDFGWIMTLGIALAFGVSFLFFPSLLVLLPPQPSVPGRDATMRTTHALAVFALRYPHKILTVFAALIVLSVFGILQLRVDNRFMDYFKESTEIYQGMRVIDTQLGGTTPLDIIIDADPAFFEYLKELEAELNLYPDPFESREDTEPNYWFNSDKLLKVEQIHDYLEALPQIGKVLSLGMTLKVIRFLNNDRVPDDFDLAIYRKIIPADARKQFLDPYLSKDANQIRLTMRIEETDPSLNRGELIDKIKGFLVDDMRIAEDRIHFTGMAVLYNNMLHSLFRSQILTLGFVFVAILLMFIILFRHLYLALLATVPNVFSALTILGLMGWLGIPLDMMTITIAAITIGIAVDDTIHYIHRFRREFAVDLDYREAIIHCHNSIGRAIYYTSITIMVGFSVLAFSNFIPTIYFGLLTGSAMLLALVGDLLLLPLLILIFKPLGPEQPSEQKTYMSRARSESHDTDNLSQE